ncbi:uncharacterized protein CCOS01_16066 [Colletotrichum costaricense]|uniref:Uncharacterized protein n=1 Tax=Colletotrichum costaricense TaxID=1209916 RepID=A0AAI9YGI3_9PEZI|nr:uncharacterized protein CCOS01_16066 [Colletotrichum costaricense]KAK1508065.1 hypothetical protein CCOS01_16066 [Colletotrichum costaricense]
MKLGEESFLSRILPNTGPKLEVDLETQVQDLNGPEASPSSTLRSQTLQAIFGLSGEEIKSFPGIQAYCDHIESQVKPLTDFGFSPIWPSLSNSTACTITDCWKFLLAVAYNFKSAEKDYSIEDLKNHVLSSGENVRESSDALLLAAVFAAVCLLTMTLQPSLDFEPFGGQICLACRFPSLTDESSPQGQIARQNLREAKRPIKRVFELFEHSAWDDQPTNMDHSIGEHDSLYEGSLNLEVLLFGRIKIQWVDTLSEHLRFDLVSRRLSIFSFPTFCVLSALRKGGKEATPLLDSINEGFMPTTLENRYQNYVTLEQEVLVSYRLLFGQSARSRNLIRSDLKKLEQSGQPFDNLLYTLCGPKKEADKLPRSIWPVGCRDFEQEKLLESDVYSAQSDFPRLGYRLINLQRFSLRQKPRRLTDLWRDRRNPLQWYTFWAVLWVGGAGIILAIIQTILAGVQVAKS